MAAGVAFAPPSVRVLCLHGRVCRAVTGRWKACPPSTADRPAAFACGLVISEAGVILSLQESQSLCICKRKGPKANTCTETLPGRGREGRRGGEGGKGEERRGDRHTLRTGVTSPPSARRQRRAQCPRSECRRSFQECPKAANHRSEKSYEA